MNQNLPGDTSLPSSDAEIRKLIAQGSETDDRPVEDFFRIPDRTNYQISPDGTRYAYLAPYKRRKNIFVASVEADEAPVQLTFLTDRSINAIAWANDSHLIFLKDSDGDENFHIWITDIHSGEARDLTPFPDVRADIINVLPEDDTHVLIAMNKEMPEAFDAYLLDVVSGHLKIVGKNSSPESPITSWIADHNGKLRAATQLVDGVNSLLLYRRSETDEFTEIVRTNYRTEVRPLFFDFENSDVLWCISNLNRDKSALVRIDGNNGQEICEPVFIHDEVDVDDAGYSRKRKRVTIASYNTDKRRYHFLDEERARIQEKLQSRWPELEVAITSSNKAEDRCIVRVYSDRTMGAYFFYDVARDEINKICDVSPWLDANEMSHQRPITYESRDGLKIHGYLTIPYNSDGKNLPIIVNPHGGPWHRDSWGFNPEVQLFASHGYGVLQMNFRSSTGYGREFWEAGFKQWGQSMQNDITDGVQWLIEQGIADPQRIAIYGASYGGYATLAGACYTPKLYACAVDYVGVSNLFTFMKTVPPYWEPYLKMMYEMVGDPEADQEMMKTYSPALNAEKIEIPLFVIQGANDPRVNIDESDQIVANLRNRGIDVPYMVKYDEGHGFRNEENQFEVYKAMLGFFRRHLSLKS